MVAFCVDIGYVLSAKEELQRSADRPALAACWEYGQRLAKGCDADSCGRLRADDGGPVRVAQQVHGHPMSLESNAGNNANGDVVFGYISDFKNSGSTFETNGANGYNAVKVRLRKNASINGEVPYFFARIFGLNGQSIEEEATAGFIHNVKGFKVPSDGSNLGILPYALDLQTWNDLIANSGTDAYKLEPRDEDGRLPDPMAWSKSTCFRKAPARPVTAARSISAAATTARPISPGKSSHGISPSDMAAIGGKLEFDAYRQAVPQRRYGHRRGRERRVGLDHRASRG